MKIATRNTGSVGLRSSPGYVAVLLLGGLLNAAANALVGEAILQGEHRTEAFAVRDDYRNPARTLAFFQVEPSMSVVEIWPGAGWYTEILAPYLRPGTYYAAHFPDNTGVAYYNTNLARFKAKLASDGDIYSAVKLALFDPKQSLLTVPDGSADRVLTFRNVHNWLGTKSEAQAFALFYKALKPGGMLGVVEHRATPGTSWEAMKSSGYMTEAYVIELAEKAGFVLDARSEINANPRDTKDYPAGVWTLPPSLRLGEKDRARYLAIGESDRMTLRFRKPDAAVR